MSLTPTKIETIIDKAEHSCVKSGGKLTVKRKHILTTLLNAETALSAYEIKISLMKRFLSCRFTGC